MNKFPFILIVALILNSIQLTASAQQSTSGNPVFEGWYADPEGVIFDDMYWIFPTYSAPYDEQLFFDAFSSPDLVKWTKHEKVLDAKAIKWAKRAMWAPSVVEKAGKYYFFFAANDIQNNEAAGGIGVAVADKPEGPYKDHLGKPLVDRFHNGAQPIDQFAFRDDDGTWYLIYGGWRHCNIARLNDDFTGFVPFDGGTTFREITPEGYVEGPFMFRRDGKYYFMWSEGGWTGPDYCVAYAIADSPFGPWKRIGKVLEQDAKIATGAGHHSVIHVPGTDEYYAVYHRRPLGEADGNSRVTCIDRMHFDDNGHILPIKITNEGVEARPLGQGRSTLSIDDTYKIEFDTTETPQLTAWVDRVLKPICAEWYPKIVTELPSDGFEPPRRFTIVFKAGMDGVAYTAGSRVVCAEPWFAANLDGEAAGAVVHELVHVVQQFRHRPHSAPGWVVEGLADYIRWFEFEPARLRPRVNFDRARYTDSYRTTGAFFDFLARTYGDKFPAQLNDLCRRGQYTDDAWKDLTGKPVDELWKEFDQSAR